MRALVIQHDHICLPGAVGEQLRARGFELVFHQIVEADRFDTPNVDTDFPDPTDFDVIVALGAPWSAYDADAIGTLGPAGAGPAPTRPRRSVPVFGICFGGQLLALAHGGSVTRSPDPELGWVGVVSDDDDLVGSGPWFQWHYDRWTLPAGATEIARNAPRLPGIRPRPQPGRAVPSRDDAGDPRRLVRHRRQGGHRPLGSRRRRSCRSRPASPIRSTANGPTASWTLSSTGSPPARPTRRSVDERAR